MGQGDVMKKLKYDEWKNSRDLDKELDESRGTITTVLGRLYKNGEVIRRHIFIDGYWEYQYKLKQLNNESKKKVKTNI